MPKSKAKTAVAPLAVKKIIPAPAFLLSLDERTALRAIFENTAFQKAWHNAKLSEPGSFPGGDLRGPAAGGIALHRILQQQGWKLFEAALLNQILDPTPPRKTVEENFPDSGMDIVNPRTLPKPPPPPPAPLYAPVEPKKKR